MPERISGIKGYVGELIVKEWLQEKHGGNCLIKSQILPNNVNTAGGPYLDLCVINKNKIIEIYEVKTQDYRLGSLNKSLSYLWKMEKGNNKKYFDEHNNEKAYIGELEAEKVLSSKLKSYLIVMTTLDYELQKKIDKFGLKRNVYLLREILKKVDEKKLLKAIKRQFGIDIPEVFQNIKNPRNG